MSNQSHLVSILIQEISPNINSINMVFVLMDGPLRLYWSFSPHWLALLVWIRVSHKILNYKTTVTCLQMCPCPPLFISQTSDVWTVLLLWADLKPTSARFKESPDTLFIRAEGSFIPAVHAASLLLPEGWAAVYLDTERTSITNVVLYLCASGSAPVPIQSGILCIIWFF